MWPGGDLGFGIKGLSAHGTELPFLALSDECLKHSSIQFPGIPQHFKHDFDLKNSCVALGNIHF